MENFKHLFSTYGYARTTSEDKYELLEPWIQWVSIHTGKSYAEHQIFRLGDIVNHPELKQLWEIGEQKGLKVGAVSPFNAANNLKRAVFFVPDPWTQTSPTGSQTLVQLSRAVSAAVNDNANQKLSGGALLALVKGVLKYVPLSRYVHYFSLASKFKRKMAKPAILDNVLADTFIHLWKASQPDFSSLFLNSGAHLQHHYMYNSQVYSGTQKNPEWYCPASEDPLLDILKEYDAILGRLIKLDCRLFIATGLHQNPHEENTYYWRLRNHTEFLKLVGIQEFKSVVPRMSRDFLIECHSVAQAKQVQERLEEMSIPGSDEKIFTVDNRGESLFIELTYSQELNTGSFINAGKQNLGIDLFKYVSFVAIKNGEHDGIGYYIDTDRKQAPSSINPVKNIFSEIVSSFG
ncbi:alkaline phosphatase family protein [Chryseolinea serpens]|uniref:alkaline phosphatase family protein n=1 Tax=Chryseolinea serpens TaxID=947013 RepID=UPI0015BA872A